MADNFDTNVAHRKPNTKKDRPRLPWDIKTPPPEQEDELSERVEVESDDDMKSDTVSPDTEPETDEDAVVEHEDVSIEKPPPKQPVFQPVQTVSTGEGLSDTITINSNYCKLHNDISDHLFRKLSPSAQAVYLRLYRQSFGWNRNWAAESLPKLTAYCNISLQTVRKAIKELETIGCIRKEFSDYHKATVYRVFLPSEIGITESDSINSGIAHSGGLNSDTPSFGGKNTAAQISKPSISGNQVPDGGSNYQDDLKNLGGENVFSGGQEINIQSRYYLGTSIYAILESGGALPKNIYKYMTNIQLADAVEIVDEFYDLIGYSIVSRAQYRKSIIDYFELIKSDFTANDIRYAVRWTFQNAKRRPTSFALLKYTIQSAMDDYIRSLKDVHGEIELAEQKKELLDKRKKWEKAEPAQSFKEEDVLTWRAVVKNLKDNLNEHSFTAFIEPLKLVAVAKDKVTIGAPPESVSWVNDHFIDKIEESYFDQTKKKVTVEVT